MLVRAWMMVLSVKGIYASGREPRGNVSSRLTPMGRSTDSLKLGGMVALMFKVSGEPWMRLMKGPGGSTAKLPPGIGFYTFSFVG